MECNNNNCRYSCKYCTKEQQVYDELLDDPEVASCKDQEAEQEEAINIHEWLSPEIVEEEESRTVAAK